MKNIEIKNRWTEKVIIAGKYESIKDCLEKNKDKNLSRANLYGASLYGANLDRANLSRANLSRANLSRANLYEANLDRANLCGANLYGAKNYYNSYDFAMEIIRRQSIKDFTAEEWVIIGQMAIHRFCWEKIKYNYGKKIISILKKLDKLGFGEYLEHYKKEGG